MIEKQCIGFLNTGPLWENEQFGIQQFDFPLLDLNLFKAVPLPKNLRLGHHMEYVFKQLITHGNTYDILLHNQPIKNGKLTIGEIDFILKHIKTRKLIHVELTYKFYIIMPQIADPIHQLMGPNRRDLFTTKLDKIKNDQFKVLHTQDGINTLINKKIDHLEVLHQACYKAQLFIPIGHTSVDISPLNKNCISGTWMRLADFNAKRFRTLQFYMPPKREWVIEPHATVQWRNHFEIQAEINLRLLEKYAPLIWMKTSASEFEKFFVVWW